MADGLNEALKEPVFFNGNYLRVSPSIGMSMYPEHGSTMDQLIKCADDAMYRAKKAGGNCYRY